MSIVQLGMLLASGAAIVFAYVKVDKWLCEVDAIIKARRLNGDGEG